jgi:carbonic anhydrase
MKSQKLRILPPFITLTLVLTLGAGLSKPQQEQRPKTMTQTKESQAALTPKQALDLLKAGNQRFVEGRLLNRDLREQARVTAAGQFPYAVILSCQDSRTSSEILFDLNKGDAFSIRIAGNIINEDVLGGMEFGVKLSGAKLIAVIGHNDCGAIKGAVDNAQLGNLTALLSKIRPAIEAIPASVQPRNSKNKTYLEMVSKENVLLAIRQIRERSPVLKEMIDSGQVRVVGGMFELETGKVRFYED